MVGMPRYNTSPGIEGVEIIEENLSVGIMQTAWPKTHRP